MAPERPVNFERLRLQRVAGNLVENMVGINKGLAVCLHLAARCDLPPAERCQWATSMMLARHTLTALGESGPDMDHLLEQARAGHYARIRAFFHSVRDVNLGAADRHHLHSVEILGTYYAVGRSIDTMERLQQVRIITIRRNGVSSEDPPPELELKTGDVLVIEGRPADIRAAEIQLMSGL